MRVAITKLQPTKILSSIWSQNLRKFSSVLTERLSDETRQQFINLVEGVSDDPYRDYLSAQKKAGIILSEILPSQTKEILQDFGRKGRSIILLQNCPVVGKGKLPPTPTSSKRSEIKDFVSEYMMCGIADLIPTNPYLIEGVRDGNVINQIIPTDPFSISGSSSRVAFDLHNEVVHERRVPDFFMLFCLRGNPFAKTNFCFLEDIIKFLPPQILEELQQPNFLMKSGDKKIFQETKEFRCPILTRDDEGNFQIRLNIQPNRCEGLTDNSRIALDYIKQCLRQRVPIHGISLRQGDALLVNNTTTLHSRTEFDEKYRGDLDDDVRWVQRMNLNDIKDASRKTR
jgi:L-asparagine oxygenase